MAFYYKGKRATHTKAAGGRAIIRGGACPTSTLESTTGLRYLG
jgi:hypothetical protein